MSFLHADAFGIQGAGLSRVHKVMQRSYAAAMALPTPPTLPLADPLRLRPDTPILAALVPVDRRPAFLSIWTFDRRLGDIVARARSHDQMLGRIRLQWWREQVALGGAYRGPDPLLGAIARLPEAVLPHLAVLIDTWEDVLTAAHFDLGAATVSADARGCALFAASLGALDVAGHPDAGRIWARVDLARNLTDWRIADALFASVAHGPGVRFESSLPAVLRALVALSRRCARRNGRMRPLADQLYLLRFAFAPRLGKRSATP